MGLTILGNVFHQPDCKSQGRMLCVAAGFAAGLGKPTFLHWSSVGCTVSGIKCAGDNAWRDFAKCLNLLRSDLQDLHRQLIGLVVNGLGTITSQCLFLLKYCIVLMAP